MKGVVRLILMRHGEAMANTDMRYLGSRDDDLAERGQWQAERLGPAVAIARAHGLDLASEPRLAEAALETWEGLRRDEIIARSPDDAEHHWEADPTCAPPGGESLAAVQARVLACLRDLSARHDGETVALFSHVGPINALLCATLDAPVAAAQRMFLDPATIGVVDWSGNADDWGARAALRLFNAHGHLGWTAARWMQSEARDGPLQSRHDPSPSSAGRSSRDGLNPRIGQRR